MPRNCNPGGRTMWVIRKLGLSVFLLSVFFTHVFAATEVSTISTSPTSINPILNETTTITVQATPGISGFEVRVLLPDQTTVVRSGLVLLETSPGTYTTTWDGKNSNGSSIAAGTYAIRVFNPGTTTFLGPWEQVNVTGFILQTSPFTPTGSNTTTITVQATPGQTGLNISLQGPYGALHDKGSVIPALRIGPLPFGP